jgi:UDP-N-acetyl-2-amino-2-deoxyglucuronate dehydrogenase
MDRIGIGVVGAGDVAERHVEGLLRASGVEIAGVAEPNEARRRTFAERHAVRVAAPDHRALLDSRDIDVVLILTPHDAHAIIAIEALRAGKHVICEKPMAPTVDDCDRMLEAAARYGKTIWVTHTLRSDFFCRVASARVAAGAVGRPIAASFRWFTDELIRLEDPSHWKGTRDRSGGGVLVDGGCHVADLGTALLGPARRVHAFGARLVTRRESVAEDTAAFSVEYESGAVGSFLLGFTAGSSWRRPGGFAAGMDVSVWGTEGAIEGGYLIRDADFRRTCIERRTGEPDRAFVDDGRCRPGDLDFELIRALRGEALPPVTALDARNAVAVIESAYRALETGEARVVDWKSAPPAPTERPRNSG